MARFDFRPKSIFRLGERAHLFLFWGVGFAVMGLFDYGDLLRLTFRPAEIGYGMGPSIYDVRKILGFFDPLPPLVRIWD